MMRPARAFALLSGLSMVLAFPLAAQRRPALDVAPSAAGAAGAVVNATNLFAEQDIRDLVRSGFPASLRFRLELWRAGGLFDDLEGRLDWDLIVQYDPTAQRYRVVRRQADQHEDLGSFSTLSTAQTVLERPSRATLSPERGGVRYYYAVALDIEALSVSDLDQLERWLRGAKSGTAASAVGNGVRTLMLRMLGGEKRHYTARSAVFVAEK
ncbi:MAG: hypothetical protein H7247_15605 [Polaromonas sp.]|nr:hypothetical protein [Gemmatimonadaceae bacterium]